MTWHICTTQKENLSSCFTETPWSYTNTIQTLQKLELREAHFAAIKQRKSFFFTIASSFLLFFVYENSVKLYIIFRAEPMHVIPLRISKIVKKF